MSSARRVGRLLSALLLAAGLLSGALLLLPTVLGWQRYVITSGSMTGTYDRGSLVLDELVPVSGLKVGDVITYRPPPGVASAPLLTHRIYAIGANARGTRVFRTKGDANPTADPWTFSLASARQARVRLGVPYAGFVVDALGGRRVRVLVLAVPAALIALSSMLGLWREAGLEAARAHR